MANIGGFLSTLENTAVNEPYNKGSTFETSTGALLPSNPTRGATAPASVVPSSPKPTAPSPNNISPNTTTTNTGPTAAQQAASAAAAAQAALQTKVNALISTGTNAAQAGGSAGTAQGTQQITDLGSNSQAAIGNQQRAIDEARKEIGVTQINSIKQLMNSIHQGLNGVGVQLGNTGALSSSARDAAGRAYANYGNVGVNTANNTAAVANQGQDVQQKDLEDIRSADKTQLDSARDTAVQSITAQAAQALDSLQTQITYLGGDPNSVNVQQIKQGIVAQAQDQLARVDANYQSLINGIHPATLDQTAQDAESASNAGVVPSSQTPFSTTSLLQNPQTTTQQAPSPDLIPLTLGNPKTQPGV